MPLLRVNATPQGLQLHGRTGMAETAFERQSKTPGPVIIMVHGYKYAPGDTNHCPHEKIFRSDEGNWPEKLGFTDESPNEGLGIAFGWYARGSLWQAHARASKLGERLARVIGVLRCHAPDRPVHVITHSLGSEIALSALPHLAPHQLNRMVLLTGASFSSRAHAMLRTPAGLTTEVLNVTSRENDLFDMAFERMVTPPVPRDVAIGQGIDLPNVTTMQLDCPKTLAVLQKLDLPVALPDRRVCHWSTYSRPGAMAFYARLLRDADALSPRALGRMLPATNAPRWSRFKRPAPNWAAPAVTLPALPLALRLKNRIMATSSAQGKHNEHAY